MRLPLPPKILVLCLFTVVEIALMIKKNAFKLKKKVVKTLTLWFSGIPHNLCHY